ncbi:GIY-YIG nuclease family protein [Yinghuangia sp. YIM S09857]|uniref:GIY-YIG nuclease family protein n=1 Tax=Yinghuangia sp. YIM S09857 TaxID=3436929 RepID=UPI003F53BFDC
MTTDEAQEPSAESTALVSPENLRSASEILVRPSPVPAAPGIYGWHFKVAPDAKLPSGQLLYVGIAPSRTTSTQNLRTRISTHFRGNASGSTLRRTLGCLLGLELRRFGVSEREHFGPTGEGKLSAWMAENARVCWVEHTEPWVPEPELIKQLDLPLNLQHNQDHPFYARLTKLRADARKSARELPVL